MPTLLTLDAENFESAIQSLADAYGVKQHAIKEFLSGLTIEGESGDNFLCEAFRRRFGLPKRLWDRISWFHLTRVPLGTTFANGILPLGRALPLIWKHLVGIQTDDRKKAVLEKLRTTGVPNLLYTLKTGNESLHGPYAMLVREVAFRSAEIGNHDYLGSPEIVEDICDGFARECGESILDDVLRTMRPCIVKFVDSEVDETDEQALLHYCWSKCRNEELCFFANTCFDAKGKTIPPSVIQKIEFL